MVIISLGASAAEAQDAAIDPGKAAQYFEEARRLSAADGGRLWGVALYGPMLFVDPATRNVVANQADAQGKLTRRDSVWTGKLPAEMGVANTAVEWAGVHWTIVMWPLPVYRHERDALMMHESFHRVQPQLGLTGRDLVNGHLDTRDGRIWLQLEWRALERALADFDDPVRRVCALTDALLFRAWRRSLFPGAAEKENALEMNEGLAEYTGQKLANSTPAELRAAAIVILHGGPNRPGFARSFAYISGPAYGAMLDSAPGSTGAWRKGLKPDADIGWLANRAYRVLLGTPVTAPSMSILRTYDGDEVIARETERDVRRQALLAAARARFADGPLLILPAAKGINYSFDPNSVTSIDDDLTLYAPVKVSDEWGILDCEKGAVLVREKGLIVRAQVPAPPDPAARSLKLDGCSLELNPGWALAPGARAGDFVLKPAP
ncbi:MAG TPA: hypothetical protein VJW51_12865 [Candidatus Acidoferrales bacterium]|nr:hypothetical protein [Candidatus Acidoferrales bacterium]